ncbi:MAG: hypothetical protein ACKOFX_02000, partial [Solirubrobacterales bacterium]
MLRSLLQPRPGRRRRSTGSTLLRAASVTALAAAVVVPHIRRQLRIPAAVTVASTVLAPAAIAVLWPRSRRRDVALFLGQMWAFAVTHELPYDNPTRLRRRLLIDYPIVADRWIGRGVLPNARLQRLLHDGPAGGVLTRISAWTHWLWFVQPYLALFWILLRDRDAFPHSARQMAAVFDLGCVVYFAAASAVTEAALSRVEPVDRLLRPGLGWSNERSIAAKGRRPRPRLPT